MICEYILLNKEYFVSFHPCIARKKVFSSDCQRDSYSRANIKIHPGNRRSFRLSSFQTLLQTTHPPSTLSLQHLFVLFIVCCLIFLNSYVWFSFKCFSFQFFFFLRPRGCHCILLLLVSSL